MPTPNQILSASAVVRAVRRDAVDKTRLFHGAAPFIGHRAFDADNEQLTAVEFAAKCLKILGMRESADPVAALECYLAGKRDAADREAGRPSQRALDAAEHSFVGRYLRGE